MKPKFFLLLLLVQSLACASWSYGKEPTSNFLAPDAIAYTLLIPDPPSRGSDEQKAEIQEMLEIQATRTPAEAERCKAEQHVSVYAFYQPVLGSWFAPDHLPATAALFAKISADDKGIVSRAKAIWKRPRPVMTDGRFHPLFNNRDASYPSGHSQAATVYGMILSEVFPEKKKELMERSREIGWDRVIAGVHWPSDIEQGRVLGKATAEGMLAEPKFRAELKKVTKELRKAAEAHGGLPKAMEEPVPAGAGR